MSGDESSVARSREWDGLHLERSGWEGVLREEPWLVPQGQAVDLLGQCKDGTSHSVTLLLGWTEVSRALETLQ